jgi:hypothetical protein
MIRIIVIKNNSHPFSFNYLEEIHLLIIARQKVDDIFYYMICRLNTHIIFWYFSSLPSAWPLSNTPEFLSLNHIRKRKASATDHAYIILNFLLNSILNICIAENIFIRFLSDDESLLPLLSSKILIMKISSFQAIISS